ncbi:MAG: SDR family oxidoreductase [Ideonella sp.]|nr:SDR family oxidoreductase [Ideonella sp.]
MTTTASTTLPIPAAMAGRVALVTGAARGIGLATVQQMARAGVQVVAFDRPGSPWADVRAAGAPGLLEAEGDVGQGSDWERVIQQTLQRFGRLDVLVNNAGVSGAIGPLMDCSDETFDEVMRVNARGVFLGLKHGARAMQGRGGSIVNVSSVSGIGGGRFTVAYTASKHAVVGMTKLAATELAASGIRVNAVCPAPTSTEMVFSMERTVSPDDPEAVRRGMTRMIPMAWYAEPAEIANLIFFLASDASSFMTGTAIPIDGGLKAA